MFDDCVQSAFISSVLIGLLLCCSLREMSLFGASLKKQKRIDFFNIWWKLLSKLSFNLLKICK